jgi:hypothetical protein
MHKKRGAFFNECCDHAGRRAIVCSSKSSSKDEKAVGGYLVVTECMK